MEIDEHHGMICGCDSCVKLKGGVSDTSVGQGHFKKDPNAVLDRGICPACKTRSFIVSIFGSICSHCFYDPSKDELPV